MNFKLFIDDIRNPVDVGHDIENWIIIRDARTAMRFINMYKPQYIAFDHHLGESFGRINQSGYDIAKWLVLDDECGDGDLITESFEFSCHSADPVGKKNIEDLLNKYIQDKFSNEKGRN